MRFLITLTFILVFGAFLNAQDTGSPKPEKADGGICITDKVEVNTADYIISDAGRKKQSGFEQFKTDILISKNVLTDKIQNCSYDDDNSCSIGNSGSCTSNIFLWSAVSMVVGIFAIASIKGR
jgi:hypothetical protein